MSDPVRGIGYDAGVIYEKDFDSNPFFTEDAARRDFRAIVADLGCTAVLVMASDPERLACAAELAAAEGLAVWLQPRPFDRPVAELRAVVAAAAETAQRLRTAGAEAGLVVGCELTLSTPGMLPGATFWRRGALLPVTFPLLPLANRRLRRLLRDLVSDARERFSGPISYGAGEWERPDWSIFDVVGLDRYREARNAWRFEGDLRAIADHAHAHGRPCYVFEFGSCAYRGAADKAATASGVLSGRTDLSVPTRLVRDEQEQADYLIELLDVFDRAGRDRRCRSRWQLDTETGLRRARPAIPRSAMTTAPIASRSHRLLATSWRVGLAVLPLAAGLVIAMILLPAAADPTEPATLATRIAVGAGISAAVVAVVALLTRYADRGHLADAGLSGAASGWRLALWGALLWTIPASAAFGVLALLGAPLRLDSPAPDLVLSVLLLLGAVLLAEAIPEEIVFRGYITTALGALVRGWGVIVVQAVLFTVFAGLLRQNWNPADLSLFLSMGIGLGYLRMITGSVWMSIGFHTAFQTGAQLVLSHDVVDFTGGAGAAMLALGVVPFTVAAIVVSSAGVPRIVGPAWGDRR